MPALCCPLGLLGWRKKNSGGRSSVGRAQDCDSCGRGFDPLRPPHFKSRVQALNGQIVVDVAQLVEPRIVTPVVEGSIPFVHPTLKAESWL